MQQTVTKTHSHQNHSQLRVSLHVLFREKIAQCLITWLINVENVHGRSPELPTLGSRTAASKLLEVRLQRQLRPAPSLTHTCRAKALRLWVTGAVYRLSTDWAATPSLLNPCSQLVT